VTIDLPDVPRVTPGWLDLREAADAEARRRDLVDLVRERLGGEPRLLIHDLGSGTGSMARWLAPQLPGRQHWVMYDRDPDLLGYARRGRMKDAGGAPVSVEARVGDITRLAADDLDGVSLITASALLDMFTADEVERVVAACHQAGCLALFTISVTGRVEFGPADPLDQPIADAFNAHQRRTAAGRTLLGPDAVDATAEAFARRGVPVEVRPSPWRLGADQAELAAEWLRGWLGAACEQRPELSGPAAGYTARRRQQIAEGQLSVTVHHHDLLASCE
jgi:SAM-dependent methyltransferase